MLRCKECNQEKEIDYFILYHGKVLCTTCALEYMVHKLERINQMLNEIVRRLDEYANRQG